MDRKFILGVLKDWGLAALVVLVGLMLWSWMLPGPRSDGIAPELSVNDLDGKAVLLADFKEPVVILNFWATWCGPCVQEIPELSAFHQSHPEIGLYGISVDNGMAAARLRAASKKIGVTYPVLQDNSGRTYSNYGLGGVPTTFILDQERRIVKVFEGTITQQDLEGAMESIQK